jgi:clan AA aspartic protease (TIGR02281 family)
MKFYNFRDLNPGPRLFAAALLVLACSWARADTFYMKSGNEIEGTTVSETASSMMVDMGYGKVNLEKADIFKIRRATKAQRETAKKQLRRNKFKSGLLVPKGAEKLSGLFRAVRIGRRKAFNARSRRAARIVEAKEIEKELSALKELYRSGSDELGGIDVQSDPDGYNRVVGELNSISNQIRTKELGRDEIRRQADKPDSSFQSYLDAYNGLQAYLQGPGKPLMEAPRKGLDEEYYAWLRVEIGKMRRDFSKDAVESEVRDGHLIVKAIINGRVSARLMVDTGATTTVLYKRVVDLLKLGPKDALRTARMALGDGRTVETQEVRLESLSVGKSVVKGSVASLLPSKSGGIDGLLGMSFLSHFVVRVDSANGKLILESMK